MADPREAILERLVVIAASIEGIKTAKRNAISQSETAHPSAVILDADESASDSDPAGRKPIAPRIITMTPEIYIVLAEKAAEVGTTLNQLRARLINAIATDAVLIGLTLNGEGGRYEGAATGLARGRSMTGEAGVSFSFRYVMRPGSI